MAAKRRIRRKGQQELALEPRCSWGGRREGSGRKRGLRPKVRHRTRLDVKGRHPQHVTLRAEASAGSLRRGGTIDAIRGALRAARERNGLRLIHYAVLGNHIHMIVEAADRKTLARGIQGLAIRLARAVNRVAGKKGRVFADRYHARSLRTPAEVRNGLAYVLQNARKHARERGRELPRGWIDPCSSAAGFDGWSNRKPTPVDTVVRPSLWLLRTGWRVYGTLHTAHVPKTAPPKPA